MNQLSNVAVQSSWEENVESIYDDAEGSLTLSRKLPKSNSHCVARTKPHARVMVSVRLSHEHAKPMERALWSHCAHECSGYSVKQSTIINWQEIADIRNDYTPKIALFLHE